jgi:AraC-like DNA-binding protein
MMGIGFFLQNFFLFFFPSILTNRKFDFKILIDNKNYNEINNGISTDLNFKNKTRRLKSLLADYLVGSPFINNKFSLKKMSFELDMSERDITDYLKNMLHTNFTDWKNKLRLDYAVKLINSGQSNFLTIQGISQSVGILSRSKFIDLFKKNTGMTPSEYIKNRAIL